MPQTPSSIASSNGLAIGGYDPVSYFDGAPRQGHPDHEVLHGGVRWRFSSAANQQRFEHAPSMFVPQYGGHCSLAMSLGNVSPGSPQSWTMADGKLYFHNSALTAFLFKYLPGRLQAATQRWSTMIHSNSVSEATHGKAGI